MLVKMIGSLTGKRNGDPAPVAGDVIDIPDAEAAVLIHQHMAVAVEAPEAAPVAAGVAEVADAAPEGEKAVATPAKAKRTRKATA